MHRRSFLFRTGGLMITVAAGGTLARAQTTDRVGMGTVIFRNRFEQTRPSPVAAIKNPLTLLEVPAYYRERFGIRKLEFWSKHFESLEPSYLRQLRSRVKRAKAELMAEALPAPATPVRVRTPRARTR